MSNITTYSSKITQIKNGYKIKNYNTFVLCISYIYLSYFFYIIYVFIDMVISLIKNNMIENGLYSIIVFSIFIIIYFVGINSVKKIHINTNKNKIVFKYGLLPFMKIKNINIDNINEISINYKVEIHGYKSYHIKEKIYCVDLIDKNDLEGCKNIYTKNII